MMPYNWDSVSEIRVGSRSVSRAYLGDTLVYYKICTVTFVDFGGNVISTQEVVRGQDAVPPDPPTYADNTYEYTTAWESGYTNVRSNITIHPTKTNVGYKMATYTFPNVNAKMTDGTALGIKTYYDERNSASRSAYKAFDNSASTNYVGKYTSSQDNGKITIVFPFNIQIQSISIRNSASELGSGATKNVGGIKTGYIYISSKAESSYFTGTVYATLNRTNASTAGGLTTHSNAAYNSTNVRSICIRGTSWGSGDSSGWHAIAEVSITFRARAVDINNWKSTYNIS